jgi:hypothetical protein
MKSEKGLSASHQKSLFSLSSHLCPLIISTNSVSVLVFDELQQGFHQRLILQFRDLSHCNSSRFRVCSVQNVSSLSPCFLTVQSNSIKLCKVTKL